ncbi:uncharacterized protein VP01_39g7 [Puccinia sorghi]|uniref:Uncharacterized protein n=1 Tax=Puccinia sorghi TaxID=27349 RepID=A0A0L6US07_9BASI|nr:uncharacterized protein VP01_39g7 [Puccinia sorghi]
MIKIYLICSNGETLATVRTPEELVLSFYHCYIIMFWKIRAGKLQPQMKYNFKAKLILGATPQASKIIPLSPE